MMFDPKEARNKAREALGDVIEELCNIAQGLDDPIERATRHGFEICRAHDPQGIMLSRDDRHWTCPECGNTRTTMGRPQCTG